MTISYQLISIFVQLYLFQINFRYINDFIAIFYRLNQLEYNSKYRSSLRAYQLKIVFESLVAATVPVGHFNLFYLTK